MQTIYASTLVSYTVLVSYIMWVCGAAVVLAKYNLTLKL
jgi:hypothetical protein